jgi:hypothetical protein
MAGCKTFTSNVADSCTACNDGYALDGTTCKKCTAPNCTCAKSDLAVCTGCITTAGFVAASGNASCDACTDANCLTCSPKETCSKCKTGYTLNKDSGQCEKCTANCDKCDNQATELCTTCSAGWGLSGEKLKTQALCLPCPSNCKVCTMDDKEKATCSECIKDYYLDGTGKCVQTNCKGTGYATNGKACTRCAYKFRLVSG